MMVGLELAGAQIQRSCLNAFSSTASSIFANSPSSCCADAHSSSVRGSCPSTVNDCSRGSCSSGRPKAGSEDLDGSVVSGQIA